MQVPSTFILVANKWCDACWESNYLCTETPTFFWVSYFYTLFCFMKIYSELGSIFLNTLITYARWCIHVQNIYINKIRTKKDALTKTYLLSRLKYNMQSVFIIWSLPRLKYIGIRREILSQNFICDSYVFNCTPKISVLHIPLTRRDNIVHALNCCCWSFSILWDSRVCCTDNNLTHLGVK